MRHFCRPDFLEYGICQLDVEVCLLANQSEFLATNPRYAAILADTAGADTEQGDA